MKIDARFISRNAMLAASYVVLTLLTYPISYLGIQVRIAEILILLCFFRKDYVIGLTLGCLIANSASFHPLDMVLGTTATLLSCLVIMYSKHLLFAIFVPVIFNGFIIGFELNFLLHEPLWLSIGTVALGEMIAMIIGYVLFRILKTNTKFFSLIDANQNLDFKI